MKSFIKTNVLHFVAVFKTKCGHKTQISPSVKIFGQCFIGNHVIIHSRSVLQCIRGGKLCIQDNSEFNVDCRIQACNSIVIGKNCIFGPRCFIGDGGHDYRNISCPIKDAPLISKGKIIIEDDCWIGVGSSIVGNVIIGKHSVVGANSVVTKNVPPYSVVAGNPAKILYQYNLDNKTWEKPSNSKFSKGDSKDGKN